MNAYQIARSKIIKAFIIIFVIILLNYSTDLAASKELLTRDQAIEVLIEHVIDISPNKDDLMAFGPLKLLKIGDVVEPAFSNTKPYGGDKVIVKYPTWFFWIDDDASNDMFSHKARFVYIDARISTPAPDKGIVVHEGGWWPKINGKHYYRHEKDRTSSNERVYGSRPSFWRILKLHDKK